MGLYIGGAKGIEDLDNIVSQFILIKWSKANIGTHFGFIDFTIYRLVPLNLLLIL